MIRVKLVWGRDLGELERKVNNFLKNCDKWHYVVRHITFNTTTSRTDISRTDIYPTAFVEYESFEENDNTCEEE